MSLELAIHHLRRAEHVAVLTGAGISAESGIPTFREAQTGYWAQFSPQELASPQAYARDPERVWAWYASRYAACQTAQPNAAHLGLGHLEALKGDGFTLVTQNVDGLHRRAGTRRLIELHGDLGTARCEACSSMQSLPAPSEFSPPPYCQRCGSRMRPHVVWFSEQLPPASLEAAWQAFAAADVALVIGTSSLVEPAASLGRLAKQRGAYLIELNPEVTPLSKSADLRISATASRGVEALLSGLAAP